MHDDEGGSFVVHHDHLLMASHGFAGMARYSHFLSPDRGHGNRIHLNSTEAHGTVRLLRPGGWAVAIGAGIWFRDGLLPMTPRLTRLGLSVTGLMPTVGCSRREDADRRADRDRADAEARLQQERDLSERRIREEREEDAESRRRDRQRENAIELIRRVSELQLRMASIPGVTLRERAGMSAFAQQRGYDAEERNREVRRLIESLRHGAWTELALLGSGEMAEKAAARYRALVGLVDEAADPRRLCGVPVARAG
jgi:hypothetical protein